MKRVVPIIFGIILSPSGVSQIDFISDSSRVLLFQELTKNINALDQNNFDFQFRVWCKFGLSIPPEYSLFVLTLDKGTWNCKAYKTNNLEQSFVSNTVSKTDSILYLQYTGKDEHRFSRR